ncbi:putative nucleic acid binding protein [Cucumis melo var. makuwa]|uniref:Putative nucleic acid binding protein n=1 Tax=Cucumis melo var. makuwa TaxID=1194695 RepID=A0A5D3E747_CUCMM|nr:putative nucleic acid binding protein [Cucumis melo var. makuwa]
MALLTNSFQDHKKPLPNKRRKKHPNPTPSPSSAQSSWDHIKNLITCKQVEVSRVQEQGKRSPAYSKLGSSCSSICSFRDVVHGNAKVVHRADNSPESSSVGQETRLLTRKSANGSSSRSLTAPAPARTKNGGSGSASYNSSSSRGIQLRKLSGWLKKDRPICKIERILKVHNTQRTIQRFEDCRDAVKTRALGSSRKNPRCAADGNELLRFHCSALLCDLGSRGSTGLCGSIPGCGVCTVIRHGFQCKPGGPPGVRTTASSGRAHDSFECGDGRRRAMLVCRVIAGRVKRISEDAGTGTTTTATDQEENVVTAAAVAASYDSVSRHSGMYSNLEELVIFNPKAILPCFVVIYEALQN